MNYKTRPGIVRLRICDVDILAAKRENWEACPKVRPLPRMWAACWAIMENDRTSEDVVHTFSNLFHQSEQEVREKLNKIFTRLYEEGFLILAGEDE